MGGNRGGGLSGRGGRGGASYPGGTGGRGGASGPSGPVRGHGSRGNFGGNKDYHNRRGGGSFTGGGGGGGGGSFQSSSGSFRARGQNHSNSGRGRHDGGGSSTFGVRDGPTNSSFNSGKKDENRRTLTDFKIAGLEIRELAWTWGVLPSAPVKSEPEEVSLDSEASQDTVKAETEDSVKPILPNGGSDAVASGSSVNLTDVKAAPPADLPVGPRAASDNGPPPSRMRIYFHTPVTAVDSHPIPHNASFSLGAPPSDSRKGKRKKIESDDGDFEEGRGPPPPPGMNDDRSSVAASVAPSVAETTSEGDWLMAAIAGEGEDDSHGADGNDDDEDEFHVSQIAEPHENDGATDGGTETDTDGNFAGSGVDISGAAAHDAHTLGAHDERPAEPDAFAVPDGVAPSSSGAVVAHVNGHGGSPPEAVPKAVSEPAPTSDASLSTLVSSAQIASTVSSVAPEAVSDVLSVPSSGPAEQGQPLTHRSNTPVLESHPLQGDHAPSLSATATLLNIDNPDVTPSHDGVVFPENNNDGEQTQELEAPQVDHLPEPPPSLSTSATSTTYGDAYQPVKPEAKGPRVPAANRLSISYEGGNRRLIFDAEVVDTITLFRHEARAEVRMNLISDGDAGLKGILMETLSEVTKSYHPIVSPPDSDFPPFSQVSPPMAITLIVYLDTARPLSEPKWVKTGDVPEWLKSLFGRMFWFAGDAAESWEKKIIVSDPDPPPTLGNVLEGWTVASGAGTLTERQRFLKTHLTEIDNVIEILLRLVRGDRSLPLVGSAQASVPPLTGPLLSALAPDSVHGTQQTHVSLAVLAMFRMTVEYAQKAGGDKGKTEVEERVGEIIRCLPPNQLHKSLDGIFKEWRVEKRSR
ncbi:hypothetical protein B0H10DRAFT_1995068 [Mycena sp. CBHHK59/15]|nr:hypothetical protein B0H10DRAFT_1995068 [Mycena sp. CBHHK59/15]